MKAAGVKGKKRKRYSCQTTRGHASVRIVCVTGVCALVTLLCGGARTRFDCVLLLFPTMLRAFIALLLQHSVERGGGEKKARESSRAKRKGVGGARKHGK